MAIFNANALAIIGTDTSKDTVMPDVLLEGYTAHDASGKQITGIHVCRMPKLQEKTVKENGVFAPDEGYAGFSKFTVAVEGSGNDYKVLATGKNINPPTVQAVSRFDKNAVVRSYSVTATVSVLE
jgi:hypothetical protein